MMQQTVSTKFYDFMKLELVEGYYEPLVHRPPIRPCSDRNRVVPIEIKKLTYQGIGCAFILGMSWGNLCDVTLFLAISINRSNPGDTLEETYKLVALCVFLFMILGFGAIALVTLNHWFWAFSISAINQFRIKLMKIKEPVGIKRRWNEVMFQETCIMVVLASVYYMARVKAIYWLLEMI